MTELDAVAERFEAHRAMLRGVAFRLLGSVPEADDAVQEAWLRLARADLAGVQNLGGWLTTVVSRVSLDMLRARAARHEDLAGQHQVAEYPSPGADPAAEAELVDEVGRALLVVLDRLPVAERVAFVLHD
ncbi:MAG TPA: sigma factor, partial [Streptosporangiaceae bacterium]